MIKHLILHHNPCFSVTSILEFRKSIIKKLKFRLKKSGSKSHVQSPHVKLPSKCSLPSVQLPSATLCFSTWCLCSSTIPPLLSLPFWEKSFFLPITRFKFIVPSSKEVRPNKFQGSGMMNISLL